MIRYTVQIDEKQYANATYPLKYGKFLDEELDYAKITLTCVDVPYFKPTTPVMVLIVNEYGGLC